MAQRAQCWGSRCQKAEPFSHLKNQGFRQEKPLSSQWLLHLQILTFEKLFNWLLLKLPRWHIPKAQLPIFLGSSGHQFCRWRDLTGKHGWRKARLGQGSEEPQAWLSRCDRSQESFIPLKGVPAPGICWWLSTLAPAPVHWISCPQIVLMVQKEGHCPDSFIPGVSRGGSSRPSLRSSASSLTSQLPALHGDGWGEGMEGTWHQGVNYSQEDFPGAFG